MGCFVDEWVGKGILFMVFKSVFMYVYMGVFM